MAYTNSNGQIRVGVRSGITNSPIIQPAFSASLIQSLYGVWNGDTTTTELDKSLFGVWNGETPGTVTTLNGSVSSAWNGDNFYSTSGITASNVNNVTLSTGKIGNAFTFNGSNYVSIPSSFMNFTGDFTANFWIKINSTAVLNQGIMGNMRWGLGPGGFQIIFNGGWLQALAGNQNNGSAGFLTQAPNGYITNFTTWTMVTFIYRKGVSNSFYINAGTPNTTAHQHTLLSSIFNGQLGSEPMDNYRLNGNLDGVTFWDRAITQNEIYALYNSTNGREYPYPSTISVDIPSPNDVVGTNHGTLMNGCTYTTGKIGNAFTFDGVNDYVALPDNIFNFTGDFSISCWFYTPSAAYAHSGIVGNYNDATSTGWGIYTYQNRLYAQLANAGGKYSTTYIDNSVVGSWNHAVMVFKKGTGFYLYMNGILRNSFTTANNANAGTSPVYSATQKSYIGLLNYSGDWWYAKNGYKIDGVNVWQRTISQDEITQLYNSGTGAQYPFTGTFSSAGNQLGMDNGTMVNGCYLSDGKVGKAFTFDEVNDYVSLPNNSLNFTGDFSVNFWVYTNISFRVQFFFSNYSVGSTYGYGYYCSMDNGKMTLTFVNGGTHESSYQIPYTWTQNWHHVVITRKRSTSTKVYINGSIVPGTFTFGDVTKNPSYQTTQICNIGGILNGTTNLLNGKMDAFTTWQKELTQAEVTELYNSGNGKQITTTPIVQTGLVLNLDASRKSSYSGSGTTWTDISGNSLNGTLTNGPVFGTASDGIINFDGVNDYISLPDSSILQPSNITISTWFKLNQFSTNYVYGNANACVIRKGMYGYEISVRQDGKLLVFAYSDVNTQNQYLIDSISLNTWYNVVLTFGNSQMKVYINNVLVGTYSTNTNSIYYGGGGISIGRQGPWDMYYFNGNIGQTMVYNRALSATEITQNFNSTKGRFGL